MRNLIIGNDAANAIQGTASGDLIYGFDPNGTTGNVASISAHRLASGLTQPIAAMAAPGDDEHLFIVERFGKIKVLDLATGSISVFLDLSSQITTVREQGLLGLAFDPNYAQNGQFYVDLSNTSGDTEVRRYQVSATDPLKADPASSTPVITIDQPDGSPIHKAGWIGFGPDNDLYVSLGDGGPENDPSHNAQNPESLLGKMLRIDVHGDDFAADAMRNYAIPGDNPFVGDSAVLPEIWALGLRNPFRDSFDRGLGTLYIGDVGQNRFEEIDLGAAGANYGWNVFEGPVGFQAGPLGPGTLTSPIYSYDHTVGRAVIGGYVYRGQSDGLQGQYFLADEVSGKVFTLQLQGSSWVATDRTSQIVPDAGAINNPVSFGEDASGDLYLLDLDGEVFKLIPNAVSGDVGDVINGLAGDDMMFGGAGNDRLNGGIGADVMSGGSGNDFYYVDNASDQVNEAVGGGVDTVVTSVSFTLGANQEVENLKTNSSAGVNLVGNRFDNVLAGGTGDDTLSGGAGNDRLNGGEGADVMDGGSGDDVFYVDNTLDRVIETAGGGTDAVFTSVSYSLAGQDIETLRAIGSTGLDLTGNARDNFLLGSTGDDTLIGGAGNDKLNGGGGGDVMKGGPGNDIYFVDDQSDQVIEAAGGGKDFVYASVSYTLAAHQEIETLRASGTADLVLAGNEFDNVVIGGPGNDTLDGASGNDRLTGGAGSDRFVFDTNFAGGNNVDTLADFDAAEDSIALDHDYFAGLMLGQLDSSQFAVGSSNGSGPQIVYNDVSGALYYDGNGAVAGGATQFASQLGVHNLTAANFFVT